MIDRLGVLFLFIGTTINAANQGKPLCQAPTTAPQKLEKVIAQCQEEIKYALLQEALSVLGETVGLANNQNTAAKIRGKRETFSGEEKRIAGVSAFISNATLMKYCTQVNYVKENPYRMFLFIIYPWLKTHLTFT